MAEPGLHCTDTGVVSIVGDDGEPLVTWKRPTLGQWRAAHEKVEQYREWLRRLQAAKQTSDDESASKKDRDAAQKVVDTEDRDAYEAVPPVIRHLLAAVPHEGGLPDDVDDWPVWVAIDYVLPGQIISYWQRRPKASGPSGQ